MKLTRHPRRPLTTPFVFFLCLEYGEFAELRDMVVPSRGDRLLSYCALCSSVCLRVIVSFSVVNIYVLLLVLLQAMVNRVYH